MKITFLYNTLLFLLIFTFPFSGKLNIIDLGFMNLYAFRIVLIICFFILLFMKKLTIPYKKQNLWLLLFCGWLLVFGIVSLTWVPDKMLAIKQLSHISWGFLTFIVVYSLCLQTENAFETIKKSWLASFLILGFFALIEILSSAHFQGSYTNQLQQYDTIRPSFFSPIATFTNPNDYAAFLVFSLILFTISFFKQKRFWNLLLMICSCFLILKTQATLAIWASRAIIFVSLIILILNSKNISLGKRWFIAQKRPTNEKHGTLFPIVIFSMMVFGFLYSVSTNPVVILDDTNDMVIKIVEPKKQVFAIIENEIEKPTPAQSNSSSYLETESFSVRKNLLLNGLYFAKESYFLGIGAGQFEHKMIHNEHPYPTKHIINPHNFIIEVFSQYGVIAIILLFLFFVNIFIPFAKRLQYYFYHNLSVESLFLLFGIPAYILVSNGPSAFISFPMNWILLTLMAYSLEKLTRNKETTLTSEIRHD